MPAHSSNFSHPTAFCTEGSFASLDVLEHSPPPRSVTSLKICLGLEEATRAGPQSLQGRPEAQGHEREGTDRPAPGRPAQPKAGGEGSRRELGAPAEPPSPGVARPAHPPASWRPRFPSLPVAAGRLRASLHRPWAGVVPAVFPSPRSLDSSPRRDSPGGPRRAHPPCSPRPSRVPPASPGAPLRPSPRPQPRSALPAPGSHALHAPRAAKVWIWESSHS